MNKIIAVSENPEEDSIIGIVIGEPFFQLARDCLSHMGFKPSKQIKNTFIMKNKEFTPGMLNDFSILSGLDSDFFAFFACHKEQFKEMLELIENEKN